MKMDKVIVSGIFLVLAAGVFYFQVPDVYFGSGHIGWVSSHTLAIIRNATPERLFLGFTCEFSGENGYSYFDRYPVLFSGLMHTLLEPFRDDFGRYIRWARSYMNVIYIACIFVGYRIALLYTRDRCVSLLAAMFTFMGVFFVFYKDMIHYDQPAILGMMVLFYTISRYELYRDTKWLWLSLGVVLLGRGYASNFLLLFWNIIYVTKLFFSHRFRLTAYIRSVQFRAFMLAGLLVVAAVSFNVLSEMKARNVPWRETSIVGSATFRLGLGSDRPRQAEFGTFTKEQFKRTVGGFVPYGIYSYEGKDSPAPAWSIIGVYFLTLFVLLVLSVKNSDLREHIKGKGGLVVLGLLGGFFWLFPLRNLAAFHNYTHMYNAVFYILMFSAIFYIFKGKKSVLGVVGVAMIMFMLSMQNVYHARLRYNQVANAINNDVDRIRAYLTAHNLNDIYFPEGYRHLVEGSPYASCLYFSGFRIARERDDATVVVTRQETHAEELLPDTELLHLYANG